MTRKMRGKAWLFKGLLEVDRDLCPYEVVRALGDRGIPQTYEEMGKYAMIGIDADFPKKVGKGDFIVAGEGMGYGHDHDHPCKAIRGAGVAAILCESTNTNFLRNCIDHGLPIVECRGISNILNQGDNLEVDLEVGRVKNLTRGGEMRFQPFPEFILDILDAGGLYPQLEQQLKARDNRK
jgi:3-isopropylmalate/(R)-2-methylmalate dehydratase small subunit